MPLLLLGYFFAELGEQAVVASEECLEKLKAKNLVQMLFLKKKEIWLAQVFSGSIN